MPALHKLWNNTLNSVPFGIVLMALIAAYIGVGSGMASVREYFEMNELQFFSTWWLIVPMVLLVATLITVTLTRIPFTSPRYGVWCVHAGIITLVYGMFIYYTFKVEGLMRIPVGATAQHFYDSYERALFARVGPRNAEPTPLPSLPRFESYPATDPKKAAYLDRNDLRGIKPTFQVATGDGEPVARSLGEEIGLKVEPTIDVIGYHPYANIFTDYVEEPSGRGRRGIKLTLVDESQQRQAEEWIVESPEGDGRTMAFGTALEHRDAPTPEAVEQYVTAATQMHRLDILVGAEGLTLFVQPGESYEVGKSGYRIEVESYLPNWRTMDQEIVDLLTIMVHAPNQKFRRQLIPGRPPTDWKLDVPGAGPMGQRQDKDKPLDKDLRISYAVSDKANILAGQAREKITLITGPGKEVVMIRATQDEGVTVSRHPEGVGEFELVQAPQRGPFQPKLTAEELAEFPRVKVRFERQESLRRLDKVVDVPKAKRDRDEGQSGVMQVATVRVTAGDFSRIVHIPFAPYAAERDVFWRGQEILIPGAARPFKLQLGNSMHPMPASVTVKAFELVPYQGGQKALGSIMRDFKSTLEISMPDTGETFAGVAHMNNPVYIERKRPFFMPDESWLLFQAQWDPRGQRWTVLGVGNRPGVITMTVGSIMIGVGLLYAFYVKPIIIQRNKRRAIQEAESRKPGGRAAVALAEAAAN